MLSVLSFFRQRVTSPIFAIVFKRLIQTSSYFQSLGTDRDASYKEKTSLLDNLIVEKIE
jgi:hypothetical protein